MQTKRIKIERPEDLKEGMRVEVEYRDESKITGKVYKINNRVSCPSLYLDYKATGWRLVEEDGSFYDEVESIHRLIDGIEDVVVGDAIVDADDWFRRCLSIKDETYEVSCSSKNLEDNNLKRYACGKTIFQMKEDDWKIYTTDEEPQKTELTQSEAKEIIAKAKGCEVDDVIIKDE